jgi:hypothetical protein
MIVNTLKKEAAVVGSINGRRFCGCTINLIKKDMKTESKNNFVTILRLLE